MKYDRQKFVESVESGLEQNIFYHSLALEACMGGIFDFLKENGAQDLGDRDDWILAGLMHDIDYAGEFKEEHPNKIKEVLQKHSLEISEEVHRIIKAHAPEKTGVKPESKAEWAIFCADSLTGLIVAVALVYPSKKLEDVKSSSVLKRFLKEPKFAAGTRRDEVAMCSNSDALNIPIDKFIEICLSSMRNIASSIGL